MCRRTLTTEKKSRGKQWIYPFHLLFLTVNETFVQLTNTIPGYKESKFKIGSYSEVIPISQIWE